jgi:hypothetical protein
VPVREVLLHGLLVCLLKIMGFHCTKGHFVMQYVSGMDGHLLISQLLAHVELLLTLITLSIVILVDFHLSDITTFVTSLPIS